MTSPTIQECRACGAGAPLDAHLCPQCSKILALNRHTDYFSFLGVPRRLHLDAADLERRFRALSRQFHPDYFINAPVAERRASLERSSYLNDAYRTLKQLVSRVEYLLEIEGRPTGNVERASGAGQASAKAAKVPPALLEEVFALNEELDEVRDLKAAGSAETAWRARLQAARLPIDAKRADHEHDIEKLALEWDRLFERSASDAERAAVLDALRDRMLERNYINNLLAGIERELIA